MSSKPNFNAGYETGKVETHSYEEDPPCDGPYFGAEPLNDLNLSEKEKKYES